MPEPLSSPQLILDVSGTAGRQRLLLCCSKEIERGVRASIFAVPRMFRLDTIVEHDTMRTVVRNLSRGSLEVAGSHHIDAGTNVVLDGVAQLSPARATIEFTVETGNERVHVDVTIGTLLLADRGLMRITAQALLTLSAPAAATVGPRA